MRSVEVGDGDGVETARVRRVRLGMNRIEGESLKRTPSSVVAIIGKVWLDIVAAYWLCPMGLLL